MPRRRNGQCQCCGSWIPYGVRGNKCPPCKAPKVTAATRNLRTAKKLDRQEWEVTKA